ncbi:hypothetical protein GCM10025865_01020 [Paraoerskovia sediminicola]|uniref:Ead/Ea22-like family protein n=1 Tax=Paraoerskovia sediminicola TaxID=1138587 RepID=A0ABM8FYI1_9CELL|nr:hypothetical protein [Paraoerskovia sediminicola]BDZ40803.1 hypothetical protein GCM10025865_01020 [Paraoerskovia sediminicola]
MSDETLDLEAIRKITDAATPGPWSWRNTGAVYLHCEHTRIVMAFSRMGMQGAQPAFRDSGGLLRDAGRENIYDYPDAKFIAHARTDVPALIAEVERLRAELDATLLNSSAYCDQANEAHTRAEKAEAERDRLRAFADAVFTQADYHTSCEDSMQPSEVAVLAAEHGITRTQED